MQNMRGLRGRLPWLSAAAVAIVASFTAIQPAAAADPPECNGAAELCAKPFNEVVLPGTHNSMSSLDLGWAIPNQLVSIPKQLDAGIRGFLIDTHYGKANDQGLVTKVPTSERNDPGVKMYLCHEFCQAGASELIPELVKVRTFLAANPGEALVFINQAGILPEDFETAVTQSGLNNHLYTGSTTGTWPTLGEMVADNQRVVMFSEGGTGAVPWYHDAYDGSLQETPYDHRSGGTTQDGIDNLTDPAKLNESCRPNRGGEVGSLFLMNHWVNGTLDNSNPIAPDPEVAKILNTKDVLVRRALACQERRGLAPTLIAVDDFGEGDLIGAVRELNGLPPLPGPDPDPDPIPDPPAIPQIRLKASAPKNVVIRAGRKAVAKVKLTNIGDGPGNVKVCATVPKRLAKKPRCGFAKLAVGGSATAAIKIQAKRRVKGSGKVKFTITSANETLTAKSTLKVKPQPKKKRKR